MDYWKECITESFEDAEIEASEDQIDTVTSWVDGAHENYGLATGNDVASANLRSSKDNEIEKLKTLLQEEIDKVTCKECHGSGTFTTYGGTFMSTSNCYKCGGQGRL